METIAIAKIVPILVAIAFVLIAPLFIYYSMKSLTNSSAGPNLCTKTCGVKIPDFLVSQHVDRKRSVRSHYRKVLARNLARRTQKERIKTLKISLNQKEEKETLRFCSVGLEKFEQINEHRKSNWRLPEYQLKGMKRIFGVPGKNIKFQPTHLTPIFEDVEY